MRHEARAPRAVMLMMLMTTVMLACLLARPAARQSAVADDYDTTKTVTLKATLKGRWMSLPPAPAVLIVDVSGAGGAQEEWIVAGGTAAFFKREGWQLLGPSSPLKGGAVLSIAAYLPKPGSHASQSLAAALRDAGTGGMKPGFIDDLDKGTARLAHGIELTLADGSRLQFGER